MKNLRILLVDADPDHCEIISSKLGQTGHSVAPVSSLEEAEEALTILKIDVALLSSPFPEEQICTFVAQLREIEKIRKNAERTPALGVIPFEAKSLDGMLPKGFDSQDLVTAYEKALRSTPNQYATEHLVTAQDIPIFEPEKFQEQVGYDPDLAVEIVYLFLEERNEELPEMERALTAGDLVRLSHVAHTIKGSLSSLHAMRARYHAQELETAAKRGNAEQCRRMLTELASDLDALEPYLLKLRDELKP